MGRARVALVAAFVAALAWALASPGATAPPKASYTVAQSTDGMFVFIRHCAVCHGANLEGKSAPALAGDGFGHDMAFGKMSTPALYAFISTSMPMNAPGTLSRRDYLDVLAFILSKNRFPAGSTPLTTTRLGSIALLPFPVPTNTPVAPAPTTTPGGSVASSRAVDTTDAQFRAAAGDGADWLLAGRAYDNERYSPLAQISTANVEHLHLVKIVHTGMIASFEDTPIVADGVMYVSTPVVAHRMKIMALDAANGNVIWSTRIGVGEFKDCCGPNNRGVAVGYGSVYVGTMDANLYALDARTGQVRWKRRVDDPSVGYSESMQPQLYDGMVIVGSAGGEWALRGFVAAYDAKTGAQRWRWYATDPQSFGNGSWKKGGGTVWTTPAIDAARHLLIFGTGNPNPDLVGTARPGANEHTCSIVALDARTGKLRWSYQEVKHDQWDYDAASNVVLFDVHEHGTTVPAAGEAGKVGWYFIVDRRTGRLIRKSNPYVMMNREMFHPGAKAVLPGANGGSEWSPPAYSPQTHDVYILGMNQLMRFHVGKNGTHPGMMNVGSIFTDDLTRPMHPVLQNGVLVALNVDTGKIAWQHQTKDPMIGGALATAGGLVFTGEGDGTFEAFDARTGVKRWRFNLGAGVNAPPVTYEEHGTQYVAVAAGGNFQIDYPRGDMIAIFAAR